MLDLPWTTVKGLHVLKTLAGREEPTSSGDLASKAGVTPGRLPRLIRILNEAGLITSVPRRGWKLARPSNEIRVLQVLEVLGAARRKPAYCRADWTTCEHRGGCALAPLCRTAHENLTEVFRNHTIADLQVELPSLF